MAGTILLSTCCTLQILAPKNLPGEQPLALLPPFSPHRLPWGSWPTPLPLAWPLLLGAWTTLEDQVTDDVAGGTLCRPYPAPRLPPEITNKKYIFLFLNPDFLN